MSIMDTNSKVTIKKQKLDVDELEKCSKEELISTIRRLTAHNEQLKNIISKLSSFKQVENNSLQKPFDFDKSNFRHVAFRILYLGWDRKGYVVQEDTQDTIEHHIFEALTKAKLIKDRASSNYHRCGRTDKGVSSYGQVISLDVRSKLSSGENNCVDGEIRYCKIINSLLPDDIRCTAWSPVENNFSARFDCKMRKYKYFFPKGFLDINKMKLASKKLIGSHDFRNLCKMDVGNGVVEFIRNIANISIEPVETNQNSELAMYVITIEANAFLWHQIRCIVGVLILIGQNKEEPHVIDELLDVTANPRKPEYSMASEIPLNLYHCHYDNISWQYDKEALGLVIDKLSTLWTFESVKSHMIADMISSLREEHRKIDDPQDIAHVNCLSECLLQGKQPRKYTPLMKRQTCNSLKDKIEHFAKRKRIEVVKK